ncbi:MAG TPA: class I SAM-dependent methyltransferase [Solirubrobacterales bacterium]|nr:class I SAM-dependent methyltransferase [Solirubrobacterales bacterium]
MNTKAIDDLPRRLAKRMLEYRYPDAHFNVSYFDFFVQGVNMAGELTFGPELARAVAAANALLARWDDPTGFDAPELSYIHSYGEFLVAEGMADFDYGAWVAASGCEMPTSFSASLAPIGTELIAYLTRLDPGLLGGADPLARARRVLALRRRLFHAEIEQREREAVRERREGNYGAALNWAYPALRLDPDNVAVREVVASVRDVEPVLPRVEVGSWLPAVEAVDGWLSQPEVAALARCVAAAPSDRAPDMVEVGSYKGRSTLAIACAISDLGLRCHLTTVDPHEGYRYGDGHDTYSTLIANLTRSKVDSAVTIVRSRGDEAQISGPLCFAFIDGLHDAESVRADHEHISPLLMPGGLLAFHDYFEHYPGIVKLVGELMFSSEFEFIECADRLVVLRRI